MQLVSLDLINEMVAKELETVIENKTTDNSKQLYNATILKNLKETGISFLLVNKVYSDILNGLDEGIYVTYDYVHNAIEDCIKEQVKTKLS